MAARHTEAFSFIASHLIPRYPDLEKEQAMLALPSRSETF
jgi:hypothetical protein